MKGSWRTTFCAIAAACVVILSQLIAAFDSDPSTTFELSKVLEALAVFGLGVAARDNSVTSEQAGAK